MRQICMDCLTQFGIKEPFENDSVSHGLCKGCYNKRIQQIKERREKMINEARNKNIGKKPD
jgi:hypothetical protein